jgi:hypothetical protein
VRTAYKGFSLFFNFNMTIGTSPRGLFGQMLLVDRENYLRVGGHKGVKGRILENCLLAEQFRAAGIPARSVTGRGVISFRMYPDGLRELIVGWTKGLASGGEPDTARHAAPRGRVDDWPNVRAAGLAYDRRLVELGRGLPALRRAGVLVQPANWGVSLVQRVAVSSVFGFFESLKTKDRAEAERLLMALNEAGRQPAMNPDLARVDLKHSDPIVAQRTLQHVFDEIVKPNPGRRSAAGAWRRRTRRST